MGIERTLTPPRPGKFIVGVCTDGHRHKKPDGPHARHPFCERPTGQLRNRGGRGGQALCGRPVDWWDA